MFLLSPEWVDATRTVGRPASLCATSDIPAEFKLLINDRQIGVTGGTPTDLHKRVTHRRTQPLLTGKGYEVGYGF